MAVIDIKKMIPIKPGVYKVVNLNKDSSDTPELAKYKDLLNKEYSFCLKIAEDLIKKANRLYDGQLETGKVKKFCCDFKLLEQVCDTYALWCEDWGEKDTVKESLKVIIGSIGVSGR